MLKVARLCLGGDEILGEGLTLIGGLKTLELKAFLVGIYMTHTHIYIYIIYIYIIYIIYFFGWELKMDWDIYQYIYVFLLMMAK